MISLLLATGAALAAPAPTDTIVVTAERRATTTAGQPLSIDRIDLDGVTDFVRPADIVNRAAGTLVQGGSGQEHLTAIRSPVLTGGAGAGSFLYLQDGVPLRSAGFANVNGLFDAGLPFAERVEVVRGPGEVTYGANAVHGLVNVVSSDPAADRGRRVSLTTGAFDRHRGVVDVGVGTAARLGLSVFSDGGYRDASGVLQVKAAASHAAALGTGTIVSRVNFHHLEQETAGYVVGEDAYRVDALRRSNPNPEAFRDVDHVVASSTWRGNWGGQEVSLTPYALYTEMDFRLHFLPSSALETNSHAAAGLLTTARRAVGPRTSLLYGVDLEWASGELREFQSRPTIFSYTQGLHYDYEVSSLAAAPFVRLRHEATGRLTLQAGARLNLTRYDYDNRTDDGVVGRFLRPADRTDDFSVVTAKLGGTYQVAPDLSVFGSLARGARPPQTTDLYRLQINETVGDVEPETLDMAELGVRLERDGWRVEAVGYAGYKRNFLFRDADGFTVDDGETVHRGIEFGAAATLTQWLRLEGTATWAEHEYAFDRVVSRDSEIIRDGNEVDTAPGTIAMVRAIVTPVEPLTITADLHHVGAYYTDAANANEYPGHEVVDLAARYSFASAMDLTFRVENVFDTRYARRADFAFGNERYFPGEERHAMVTLSRAW
jgi:outer membrane receptor protein involved in Fe transport